MENTSAIITIYPATVRIVAPWIYQGVVHRHAALPNWYVLGLIMARQLDKHSVLRDR